MRDDVASAQCRRETARSGRERARMSNSRDAWRMGSMTASKSHWRTMLDISQHAQGVSDGGGALFEGAIAAAGCAGGSIPACCCAQAAERAGLAQLEQLLQWISKRWTPGLGWVF